MDIIWHHAKTYDKTAPHEYILEKEYPELFARAKAKIKAEGKSEPFRIFKSVVWNRYIYTDTHRYWIMGDVLNRDSRYGLKCKERPKEHFVSTTAKHPYCADCDEYFNTEKQKGLHKCQKVS